MARFAIATAGDDKYLGILQGLVLSIRSKPEGAEVPIVALDLGFGEGSLDWLGRHGVRTVVPDWDYPFSGAMPEYFKAMVSRPHLPKYVTEAETIVWLDADTWVQDWSAVDLLLRGAETQGFAIVPEVDRSYTPYYNEAPYINHQFDWYRRCFDEPTARQLFVYPLLNCGVLAARADAPHWAAWAARLSDSFSRAILFVSEQTALNVALRLDGLPVALMPSTCNWICFRSQPFCTADGRTLLDPQLPHAPLGIVHLAGYSYDTKDRPFTLQTPDGGTVTRSLQFAA